MEKFIIRLLLPDGSLVSWYAWYENFLHREIYSRYFYTSEIIQELLAKYNAKVCQYQSSQILDWSTFEFNSEADYIAFVLRWS